MSLAIIGGRSEPGRALARRHAAGRALVRDLGTDDEEIRAIAGMMLVKSGRKAEPLLQEALYRRENVSTVLAVLGSIGDPSMEPEIRRFADDKDPLVSKAARDALRLVHYKT